MSFRDQIKALLVPEKAKDAEPILDALDTQFATYDADIKRLKAELRSKDGIKPEDFERIETENAELRKQIADHAKAIKKAEAEAKAAGDTVAAKSARLQALIRDEGLTKELVSAGVKKEFMGPVTAFLRDRVAVDEDAGHAFVLSKDKAGAETRLALPDFVKSWAQSDEGKYFVSAPGNAGAGVLGVRPGATTGARVMSRTEFDTLSPSDRVDFSKSGGSLTD